MIKIEDRCILCGEIYLMSARGLCTRCYPKVRVVGNLHQYEPKRDNWKLYANKVTAMYKDGMTAQQISAQLGFSERKILNIL